MEPDLTILLKITEYDKPSKWDAVIDFIVIDCEGDILNHDALGLENYDFDRLFIQIPM